MSAIAAKRASRASADNKSATNYIGLSNQTGRSFRPK
jgi:hypothetical protein